MAGKLLMMGSFEDPGAMELHYESGLKKLGWEVHRFEIAQNFAARISRNLLTRFINRIEPNLLTREINIEAVGAVTSLKPDVVLVFKGMALHPHTLTAIRRHTSLLVNYNPDHPLQVYSAGGTNKNVIKGIGRYDVFVSYSSNICKKIKAMNGPAAYTIPFGFINHLGDEHTGHQVQEQNNVFAFVGAWDQDRERLFNELNRTDVAIYGGPAWLQSRSGSLTRRLYQNKGLHSTELARCFQNATGILNFMRAQNMDEASHNMRTFEVPGLGGLLLSPFTQEQASFFEPDTEAVYFSNLAELREKMDYLSVNPQAVSNIKKNAKQRSINSRYSYDDRAAELSHIITSSLKK